MSRLFALALLVGCPAPVPTPTDAVEPPTPTADTGDDGRTPLTFELTGDTEGLAFSLQRISGGIAVPIEVEATAEVTGTEVTVRMPPPDPSELQTLQNEPVLSIAYYAGALHEDIDGDLEPDAGEPYAAVTRPLILFLASSDGSNPLSQTWSLGWNVTDGNTPLPLSNIPLPVRPETTTFSLSGTTEAAPSTRLAAVPWLASAAAAPAPLPLDVPLESAWTAELTGVPAHRVTGDPKFPEGSASYRLVAYEDDDDQAGYTAGDTEVGQVCGPRNVGIAMFWYPPSDDLFESSRRSGQTGWVAVEVRSGTPIAWRLADTLSDLTIGDCGSF